MLPLSFHPLRRIGSEREAAMQLLRKFYKAAEAGKPLLIKSAAALDHVKVRA